MNGKKAKAIRRAAGATASAGVDQLLRNRKTGAVMNSPSSEKAMVKQIKKKFMKGTK